MRAPTSSSATSPRRTACRRATSPSSAPAPGRCADGRPTGTTSERLGWPAPAGPGTSRRPTSTATAQTSSCRRSASSAAKVNRWAQLQELAMANDGLLRVPGRRGRTSCAGDDIAGHQRNPFFVRRPDGRYVDISAQLGLRQHRHQPRASPSATSTTTAGRTWWSPTSGRGRSSCATSARPRLPRPAPAAARGVGSGRPAAPGDRCRGHRDHARRRRAARPALPGQRAHRRQCAGAALRARPAPRTRSPSRSRGGTAGCASTR